MALNMVYLGESFHMHLKSISAAVVESSRSVGRVELIDSVQVSILVFLSACSVSY